MKVIWISPEIPYPANTGGRIGIMKRLEYFGINNEIHFFCIVDSEKDFQYRSNLLQYCKSVQLYNRNDCKIKSLLKSIWLGPYACISRSNKSMTNDIDYVFRQGVDYVIVDFPQMLGALSESVLNSGKVVLNQHNIEYLTMNNLSKSISNPIKKFIFKYDSKRLEKWERDYYSKYKFKLYTFVSTEDKAFFENEFHINNTYLVPVGSEISEYPTCVPNGKVISYFGKMDYPPNAEAAVWFVDNVFNLVLKQIPDAKFYIVGKNPIETLKNLVKINNNVVVTGTVDSVTPYYEQSTLVVVPLSHGGGVKVKLLEGLGKGCLMLSTSKGIEGTIFKPNVDVLSADAPEEMAELIVKALNNPSDYEDIRMTGYERVKNSFSWKSVISNFETTLKSLLYDNH